MAGDKSRFWVGVCYLENMRSDWVETIGDLLQVPYAYCIHDKDKTSKEDEDRKDHVHIILAFPNTTTYNHALSVFHELSELGKVCINKCERVFHIRNKFDYLIHNTETCKKQKKHLYDVSERITGNNFDIGAYEQLTVTDKIVIKKEIAALIKKERFYNFIDLHDYVADNLDAQYYQVFTENQGFFSNLVRGYYNKVRSKLTGEYDYINQLLDSEKMNAIVDSNEKEATE